MQWSYGCQFSVQGRSSLKSSLLVQVVLSKEFSGTRRSHASSNTRANIVRIHFWENVAPELHFLAAMCSELPSTSKMRERTKQNKKQKSRHMAMREVAEIAVRTGRGERWKCIAIVTVDSPPRIPQQTQTHGLTSD